jgi:5-methylcytosine-specific restriction endonuclease McrA
MPRRAPIHHAHRTGHSSTALIRAYRKSPERMADNRFYASTAWMKLRRYKLNVDPLCQECKQRSLVVPATEVHHVKERREYPDLELDYDNLQSLCRDCHAAKRIKA